MPTHLTTLESLYGKGNRFQADVPVESWCSGQNVLVFQKDRLQRKRIPTYNNKKNTSFLRAPSNGIRTWAAAFALSKGQTCLGRSSGSRPKILQRRWHRPRTGDRNVQVLEAEAHGLEYFIIIHNKIGTDPSVGTWSPTPSTSWVCFPYFLHVSMLPGMDHIWYINLEKTPD